jgi:putative flippase GtrA
MASQLSITLGRFRDRVAGSALKFGAVGIVCYAIDVGVFNLLRIGVLGSDHFFQGPIGAKIISVTVSTLASWFGNRLWTFRQDRRRNFMLELLEFSAIAAVGMGINLLCLWVSHYLLGYQTLLADNISTLVGLVLATAFRYLLYRFWVYGDYRSDRVVSHPIRGRTPAGAQDDP